MPIAISSSPGRDWHVVCLCADWCGTCRDYLPELTALAARETGARFVWVDVEDDADWIGELDIETFPTILVLDRAEPLFFGALPPQIGILERTLGALRTGDTSPVSLDATSADAMRALVDRLAHWTG